MVYQECGVGTSPTCSDSGINSNHEFWEDKVMCACLREHILDPTPHQFCTLPRFQLFFNKNISFEFFRVRLV